MRKYYLTLALLFPFVAFAQTITTFAGNGIISNLGDGGIATSASIDYPSTIVFDNKGNCYFSTGVNGNTIRKIDETGIITKFGGTGIAGFSGDGGAAISAKLANVNAMAFDNADNLYVSDNSNYRIRKINLTTGIISSIAGTGVSGDSGDGGSAILAKLGGVNGICVDRFGSIYISDGVNYRVRKINAAGVISNYVGTGISGFSGDGGAATSAQLGVIGGLCIDTEGNLYISDRSNVRIRKVNTLGIITTIAGTGVAGYNGDGGFALTAELNNPLQPIIDKAGNLYVPEVYNQRIRKINSVGIISTVAGTGVEGFSGDNADAINAKLSIPQVVALDTCGNIYISDVGNYRIRKVALNPSCIPVSVHGIKKTSAQVSIYPNPAHNELYIQGEVTHYRILDVVGAVQQQGAVQGAVVPVSSLPAGMYLFEGTGEAGQKVVLRFSRQ